MCSQYGGFAGEQWSFAGFGKQSTGEYAPLLNMCTSLLVRFDKVIVQTLVDPSLYFNHTVQCTKKHIKLPGLPGCILRCLCFLVQWQ